MSACIKAISGFVLFGLLATAGPKAPTHDRPTIAAASVRGMIGLLNVRKRGRDAGADLSGVAVWLEPLDAGSMRPARPSRHILTQRGKRFIPHVLTIGVGSEVEFPNEDPFFHNVFSIYDGRRFDLGLYASGETRPVRFARPGVSYIFCNIHPQMSAVVLALDTPYSAVSDTRGAFVIPVVPEGRYRLRVWHERATSETLQALERTVQAGAVDLDLGVIRVSEEGYLPRPHRNKHGEEYDARRDRPAYRKP